VKAGPRLQRGGRGMVLGRAAWVLGSAACKAALSIWDREGPKEIRGSKEDPGGSNEIHGRSCRDAEGAWKEWRRRGLGSAISTRKGAPGWST